MIVFELAVVGGLMLLNGFFAMSELAVVSSRRGRLQHLARSGSRGAATALRLLEDPTGFLSTVQVGITLVGIFAGAYSGATLAGPLADLLRTVPWIGSAAPNVAFVLVVVSITYLSLVVGELVPKRVALSNAEAIAAFVAPFMATLSRLGTPVVWFLKLSTEAVLRVIGITPKPESTVTEEEVKSLIAEGTEAGVFHEAEREMIEGVIRIADRSVRSIMVPRPAVAWLDTNADTDSVLEEVRRHRHSRYPVCGGAIDNVIGVVHTKELLDQLRQSGRVDLEALVREPLYVSESMPVLHILERFRTAAVHMAIVVDERGTFEGIVTPMDILSGIVGSLPEEERDGIPAAVRRADGSWLLDGSLPVHVAEQTLSVSGMALDDYETLAGFVLFNLAHIPAAGETFAWNGWRFEVADMDGRRVDKVIASELKELTPVDAG